MVVHLELTKLMRKENGTANSKMESFGTKPIRIRVNHPQSNGKTEKWFDLYEKYREVMNLLVQLHKTL